MSKLMIGSIVFLFAAAIFATWQITKSNTLAAMEVEKARLEEDYAGYKRLADLEVERQKRIVEAKQAEIVQAARTVIEREGEIAGLKRELDNDGDGVHIPIDLCSGKPEAGQPSAVNTKGCLDNEAALSCKAVRDTVDNPGVQWEFSDCPLADDVEIGYVCTGVIENNAWKSITDCHSFDRAHPGG